MNHVPTADEIETALADVRRRLLAHPIYQRVDSLPRLREFMRNHVFAVWDFMSLLKRLEAELAGCTLPWQPPADAALARFVKEIVLAEECDVDGAGGYASHFELYGRAMDEAGADRRPIDRFLAALTQGLDPAAAFGEVSVPETTRAFVLWNLRLARDGRPHEVAAAFCFGREDVIPDMFRRLVETLARQGRTFDRLTYYLRRHIELDGDQHGPLAQRMVQHLCGNNTERRREAAECARQALEMRIRLWDGIIDSMSAIADDPA